MKMILAAALAVSAVAVAVPAFAQIENHAPTPMPSDRGNNPYNNLTNAKGDDRFNTPRNQNAIDLALYQDRLLLSQIKQALKNPDLSDEDRAALKAKKAEVEHDIVSLQQE